MRFDTAEDCLSHVASVVEFVVEVVDSLEKLSLASTPYVVSSVKIASIVLDTVVLSVSLRGPLVSM